MILGTILSGRPNRTSFGLEHSVEFDINSEAKSMSGLEGTALANEHYSPGDRVVLQYRSSSGYGLWFIARAYDEGTEDRTNQQEDCRFNSGAC